MATLLPKVTIQSTGAAQTAVPFTFGQVFAPGHLLPAEGLAAEGVPLQVDVKATHPDGSVRHAVISGVLSRLGAGEKVGLQLVKAPLRLDDLAPLPPDLTAAADILLGGVAYTATVKESQFESAWLMGSIVREAIATAPLRTAAGDVHPRLSVRFGVRWCPGAKRARIEFVIENTKTFTAASNETYDVALMLNGQVVCERKALTHYHHARWRQVAWTGGEPALIVHPDTAYLIATKAVSNYDQSIVPAESALADWVAKLNDTNTGPMTIGPMSAYMPMTGGRPDIGPLPQWSALYLLSGDKRAYQVMMAVAEGSGSWSTHYREESTGYPLRVDNEQNKLVSMHMNLAHRGPLPVPRFVSNEAAASQTPYTADTAHQPSLVYLPYLITGEYFYLEELQFWAAWNPLETDSNNSGNGLGLVRWQQIRGQAWSMRTLGHVAYITPDAHPLKPYFVKMLDNNLSYYQEMAAAPTANPMGAYDGQYPGAFVNDSGYAPWQDDFFTWSMGYLAELGFEKALPILKWKAKFPVGRMTASGFCWTQATSYYLLFSDGAGKPRYTTFADIYKGNFGDGNARDDGGATLVHPKGLRFIDQPCGSEEQAEWFRTFMPWWIKGRMIGYADSIEGYPANMQPALAVAAASGIENGAKAWQVFDSRTAKPDYRKGPQWAIVPRTAEAVPVPPVAEPVPTPTPAPAPKALKITSPSSTKLAKLKGLTVEVFNPTTLKTIKTFTGVSASTKGVVAVSDSTLVKAIQYAATVKNAAGAVVLVFYPLSAV